MLLGKLSPTGRLNRRYDDWIFELDPGWVAVWRLDVGLYYHKSIDQIALFSMQCRTGPVSRCVSD